MNNESISLEFFASSASNSLIYDKTEVIREINHRVNDQIKYIGRNGEFTIEGLKLFPEISLSEFLYNQLILGKGSNIAKIISLKLNKENYYLTDLESFLSHLVESYESRKELIFETNNYSILKNFYSNIQLILSNILSRFKVEAKENSIERAESIFFEQEIKRIEFTSQQIERVNTLDLFLSLIQWTKQNFINLDFHYKSFLSSQISKTKIIEDLYKKNEINDLEPKSFFFLINERYRNLENYEETLKSIFNESFNEFSALFFLLSLIEYLQKKEIGNNLKEKFLRDFNLSAKKDFPVLCGLLFFDSLIEKSEILKPIDINLEMKKAFYMINSLTSDHSIFIPYIITLAICFKCHDGISLFLSLNNNCWKNEEFELYYMKTFVSKGLKNEVFNLYFLKERSMDFLKKVLVILDQSQKINYVMKLHPLNEQHNELIINHLLELGESNILFKKLIQLNQLERAIKLLDDENTNNKKNKLLMKICLSFNQSFSKNSSFSASIQSNPNSNMNIEENSYSKRIYSKKKSTEKSQILTRSMAKRNKEYLEMIK